MTKRTAYLAGLAAIVAGGALAGSAYLWRAYRRTRTTRVDFQGARYTRHPDGSFTGPDGAPIAGQRLEDVRAHWEFIGRQA